MCIRDSAWPHAGDELAVDALLHPGAAAQLAIGRGGTSLACLLYTSDAADERSSVDLGGRRIIKKKKSERNSMREY